MEKNRVAFTILQTTRTSQKTPNPNRCAVLGSRNIAATLAGSDPKHCPSRAMSRQGQPYRDIKATMGTSVIHANGTMANDEKNTFQNQRGMVNMLP